MSAGAKHPRLPDPPAALGPAAAERLSGLVADALGHQRRVTAQAIEQVFDHVPRLLRVPVRKILGV